MPNGSEVFSYVTKLIQNRQPEKDTIWSQTNPFEYLKNNINNEISQTDPTAAIGT